MKNQTNLKLLLYFLICPFFLIGQTPSQLKDIQPQELKTVSNEYNTNRRLVVEDKLFFFEEDPCYGLEQVVAGSNGKAYFLTDNCNKDFKLWETDGTSNETTLLADLSNFFAIDDSIYVKDDLLYFVGNDGQSGKELWAIDLSSNPPINGVDLSLSISPINPVVDIYKNVTLSLTVTNSGTTNAGSFVIDFPIPPGLAFVNQYVPVGTFSNWNGKWNLPGLNAGQSATLDLTLFTLTTDPINVYAQVESASEADSDSSPGNGTPPIVIEDDETLTTINGSISNCSFTDFNLIVSDCKDNGTPDLTDDYFSFTVQPVGINLGSTFTIIETSVGGGIFTFPNIPYGNRYNSNNFLLSDGDVDIQIIDADGVCTANFTATAPTPCLIQNSNPELAISFTDNTPSSIFVSNGFDFELLSENDGTGAPASFNIGTYLSEDQFLSNDDLQLSSFTYTLDANSSEVITPSVFLANNLTPSVVYIIVKTDDNDGYVENDEIDNIDVHRLEIRNTTPYECEKFSVATDEIICTKQNINGNIDVISGNSGNYLVSSFDQDGNLIPPTNGFSYQPTKTNIVNNKIEKTDANGNILSSLDLSAAILTSYDAVVDADELMGGSAGYVLAAYRNTNAYSVFLDINLNFVSETELVPNYFTSTVIATEDGGAMVGAFNNFPTLPQGTPSDAVVHKVSPSNQVEYNFPLASYLTDSERLPCGNIKFTGEQISAGGGGSNNFNHSFEVDPSGNSANVVSFKASGTSSFNPIFEVSDTRAFYQADGSRLVYRYFHSFENAAFGIPGVEYYRLTKLDQFNNEIYQKDLNEDVFLFAGDFDLYELDNGEVIFVGQKFNSIWFYTPDCNSLPPTTCDNNLLFNPDYESSNNSPQGWYSLGGISLTSDANSGSNALLISGNAPSGILQNLPGNSGETYTLKTQVKLGAASGTSTDNFISLKFLSSSWQPIYTETVTVFPSADFEEVTVTFLAPANTAYVEAKAFKGTGDYDMIVDDWCLTIGGTTDPCDNDIESPVITFCPNDVLINTFETSAISTFRPSPIFTDNCTATIVSAPPYAPDYEFPLGNTTMTYVIADAAGNQVSCSYDIVVVQQIINSCQGNLVVNPGFENGLAGWNVPTGTWEITSDAASGQQALALSRGSSPILSGYVTQTIPASGNKRYTIEAYIQVAGPGQTIIAQAYDANNSPLGTQSVSGTISVPAGYSLLSLDYDTPANATSLEIRIVTASSGFVEIDAVCITESDISGGNGPDLEVSINASINSFDAWQSFDLTVAVQNTGTETVDNIVLDFPQPAGVVFQGGNEYTASQGNYNPYAPQEWNVGSLAAGETALITFHLFTTQAANPIVAYTQVLSMDQTDSDSNPGNGICCTPNEDDEAVVAINPATNSPISRQADTATKDNLEAIKFFPNPAYDQITLIVEAPKAENSRFEIYDLKGSLIDIEYLDLNAGFNQIQLDLSDLEAGMYYAIFPDAQGRKNRLRFVKID